MTDAEAYREAHRRAGAKLGFYIHLVVYILVNALLATINYTRNPLHLWFLYPLFGWGFGLFCHWFVTFIVPGMTHRMAQRELDKRE